MSNTKSFEKRKYFHITDLLVVLLVLIVTAVGIVPFLRKEDAKSMTAVISVNGKVYTRVSLSSVDEPYDLNIPVDEGELVVHITNTYVQITSSPCEDKLCVNTGKLTNSLQSAVCLPMRVSVKLVSAEDRDESDMPDAVVG